MPFDHVAAGFLVRLVVAGVIHHQLGAVLFPILDRRKAEVLVEIPADLHFGAEDRRVKAILGSDLSPFLLRGHIVSALHKFKVDAAVVRIVFAPLLPELPKGEHLGVGILRPHRFQPVRQVIRVDPLKQREFPVHGKEAVAILRDRLRIEVHIRHMQHLLQSKFRSVVGVGLDGANAHPMASGV